MFYKNEFDPIQCQLICQMPAQREIFIRRVNFPLNFSCIENQLASRLSRAREIRPKKSKSSLGCFEDDRLY